MRLALDLIGTVVAGLVAAVVFVALAPVLCIYIIISNWDWEGRS